MTPTEGRVSNVHPARVRWLRGGAPRVGARYVLYWIQVNQRATMNAALDLAVEEADALGLPVVAYQGLRPDYPAANDRIHTFVLEGAFDLRRGLARKGILHLFHLERRRAAASGLLAALARDAALVVTDHLPTFIVPGQGRALARQAERPVAAVEASCIVPAGLFPRAEFAARTIRPKIHRLLPDHIVPREEIAPRRPSLGLDVPFPFAGRGIEAEESGWLDLALPRGARGRAAEESRRDRIREWVASCAIDHSVAPSPLFRGGENEARNRLKDFVGLRLSDYAVARNDPAIEGTSNLSPYLHFGQISALEVALAALTAPTRAALQRALAAPDSSVGGFLEQLIVRRELAFNFCEHNPRHASVEGLPAWALATLEEHIRDPRPHRYGREALEWSETGDEVWNAAQQELRVTGVIHNRLRMLWGKKILEWSETPSGAVRLMIDLHDRYALDGRDPNTYTGILWCLGLHDRPFGPGRPILGTVRPMSTEIARRKFDLEAYRARLAALEGAA